MLVLILFKVIDVSDDDNNNKVWNQTPSHSEAKLRRREAKTTHKDTRSLRQSHAQCACTLNVKPDSIGRTAEDRSEPIDTCLSRTVDHNHYRSASIPTPS